MTKIVFQGLEHQISLINGRAFVLEIENSALFSRVVESLFIGAGEDAKEPFSLWHDEKKIPCKNAFISIFNPFVLPYSDRDFLNAIFETVDKRIQEDEARRLRIFSFAQGIEKELSEIGISLGADYDFASEYDTKKYLKAFSFGAENKDDLPLVERLKNLFAIMSDIGIKKPLLFVNLKNFLKKEDTCALYESIFFHNIQVLLLENRHDTISYENEDKLYIDQHFLEH